MQSLDHERPKDSLRCSPLITPRLRISRSGRSQQTFELSSCRNSTTGPDFSNVRLAFQLVQVGDPWYDRTTSALKYWADVLGVLFWSRTWSQRSWNGNLVAQALNYRPILYSNVQEHKTNSTLRGVHVSRGSIGLLHDFPA